MAERNGNGNNQNSTLFVITQAGSKHRLRVQNVE
jgi:hypothetical protein